MRCLPAPMVSNPAGWPSREDEQSAPRVVFWFRVYAAALALAGLVMTSFGATMGLPGDRLSLPPSEAFRGPIYIGCGAFFLIAGLIAALPGNQPWRYKLGGVLLIAGMMGLASIPFALALLHFWTKAPVKRWFGTGPDAARRTPARRYCRPPAPQ